MKITAEPASVRRSSAVSTGPWRGRSLEASLPVPTTALPHVLEAEGAVAF
jgi:hypothetical protein